MYERAKHFTIHHLFLLLKVQFIKSLTASGIDRDKQDKQV